MSSGDIELTSGRETGPLRKTSPRDPTATPTASASFTVTVNMAVSVSVPPLVARLVRGLARGMAQKGKRMSFFFFVDRQVMIDRVGG